MITLAKLRNLDLSAGSASGRPDFLSAASGLVCVGSNIYVIADDELHLAVFSTIHSEPGHLVRIFDGELPLKNPARKRRKPDIEALAKLPASGDFPHGALIAIGSGSTPDRRRGVLLGLDANGALNGRSQSLDLAPILVPLAEEFADLNIEGRRRRRR